MQYKLILAAASVAVLAACTPAQVPSIDGGESSSAATVGTMTGGGGGTDGGSADVRVVDVLVTDWTFTPSTITAKQGEKVQLRLTGDKGIHGFQVADLGLNVRVASGEVAAVDLPTDTVGTFAGRCNVPCGPGHRDMKFTVVIE